jgi:hypothetical protein
MNHSSGIDDTEKWGQTIVWFCVLLLTALVMAAT